MQTLKTSKGCSGNYSQASTSKNIDISKDPDQALNKSGKKSKKGTKRAANNVDRKTSEMDEKMKEQKVPDKVSVASPVRNRERAVSGDISSPTLKLPASERHSSPWAGLNTGADKSSSSGSDTTKRIKKGKSNALA
jgi:hypothetical protein